MNSNSFNYKEQDVFQLGPEDYHSFGIEKIASFTDISFTEVFVSEISSSKNKSWQVIADFVINTSPRLSGSVVNNEAHKGLLKRLLHALMYEYEHRDDASFDVLMEGLMKSIITYSSCLPDHIKTPQLIENLISYVRLHIHSPEHLRIANPVEIFH